MSALGFRLGEGPALAVGVVLLLLGLVAAAWGYRRALEEERGGWAFRLLLLRIGALLLTALILLDPTVTWTAGVQERRSLAILIDDSRSMSIRDAPGGCSRAEYARRILFGEEGRPGLAAALGREWHPTYHLFARRVLRTAAAGAADPERAARGEESFIHRALERTAAREREHPLGAMLLISDGRETGPPGPPPSLAVPVHTLGLGSTRETPGEGDIVLREVHLDRRALLANRVEALLEVECRGREGVETELTLSREGQEVVRRRVRLERGENRIELPFIPRVAGHHRYRAALAGAPGEKHLENNARSFILSVDPRKLRVLYYEARPRWKFKFLRQGLLRDKNLAVTFLLRTNPDRLTRQGTPPVPLPSGFPADMRSLAAFDCLVLGDLTTADLTEEQWRLLATYVSRTGGGLLLLGGSSTWSPGALAGAPLGPILPCAGGLGEVRGRLLVRVARIGRGHPVLAGLEEFFQGGREEFFALGNAFRLEGFRPGAQILATLEPPGGGGSLPLVAVQRSGAGRTLLFASSTDWKWVTRRRRQGGELLFNHLYGQALRWLAGRDEVLDRAGEEAVLRLDRAVVKAGEGLRIFLALPAGASPRGRVTAGEEEWSLEFTPERKGLGALFIPRRAGRHRVRVGIPGLEKELEATFLVEKEEKEMLHTTLDRAWLEGLARATGGRWFDAPTAGSIPEALEKSLYTGEEKRELHARSTPFLFLLILALLGAEWWLRRKRYGI